MLKQRGYKILEWNINQATNKNGTNEIPELVINELAKKNSDLIILTEFCFCKNAKDFLRRALQERDYDYFPKAATQNTKNGQNEVLIAWRRELFEGVQDKMYSVETTWENNHPNCTMVQLEEKRNGNKVTVAGLRITMAKKIPEHLPKQDLQKEFQEQANLRRRQMEYIYHLLEEHPVVIIGGDFNNFRRGSCLKNWNINELNCSRKEYTVYTPSGQSIYEEEKDNKDYEFAEDHFITKNCVVKNYVYDRGFMNGDGERRIYKSGNNFPDWKELKGFPDHAVLYGELWITDEEI